MTNYIYIDVVDTAVLCNLQIKPTSAGRIEAEAKCPFCCDRKYRMYLSRARNNATFYCHNCGARGNAVTLYAAIYNVTTQQAYLDLVANPNVSKDAVDNVYTSHEIKPPEERHRIYLTMLEMLTLHDNHKINLRERGLPDKMIDGNMYRSMPESWLERKTIAQRLSETFNLSGMPGFFTKNCEWQLYGKPGILIPVCTKCNLIQGLQIRLNDAGNKKFRWLSTNGFDNGTKINGYIHVSGDTSSDTLYITEGPLKADVASYLAGGALFAGLTGVNAVQYLPEVIKSLNPRRIVECLDMDKLANSEVRKALHKLQSIAVPLCEEYKPFYWSESLKGIDDYLLHKAKSRYAV
jgi:transcription elongation factor Elf1